MANAHETAKHSPSDSDSKERRKIQNRINQRASRQRKALLSQSKSNGNIRKWTIYTKPTENILNERAIQCIETKPAIKAETEKSIALRLCDIDPKTMRTMLQRFQESINQAMMAGCISSDLLLSVTQLNIVRAMFSNAASMGLTMEVLIEDIVSPWNITGPLITTNIPSLEPTPLQKSVMHHPWIDLCPSASMRDALLRNLDRFDEDDICEDLFGHYGQSDAELGLAVWGEAWDPAGYELSERMLRKWWWIFKDCPDVILASNYWRSTRGERPLLIKN